MIGEKKEQKREGKRVFYLFLSVNITKMDESGVKR
jgi:hypothetical protein